MLRVPIITILIEMPCSIKHCDFDQKTNALILRNTTALHVTERMILYKLAVP